MIIRILSLSTTCCYKIQISASEFRSFLIVCVLSPSLRQYCPTDRNMPRNVEIKARANADLEVLIRRAECFAETELEDLKTFTQDDVFFNLPSGRQGMLKIRESQLDHSRELIYYDREKSTGPKLSSYNKCYVTEELKTLLTNALGTWGEVNKVRSLLLVGQTRIHFDAVEGLGDFVELEVVLNDNQTVEEGQQIAMKLMSQMGLEEKDLISGAYVDLLQAN